MQTSEQRPDKDDATQNRYGAYNGTGNPNKVPAGLSDLFFNYDLSDAKLETGYNNIRMLELAGDVISAVNSTIQQHTAGWTGLDILPEDLVADFYRRL